MCGMAQTHHPCLKGDMPASSPFLTSNGRRRSLSRGKLYPEGAKITNNKCSSLTGSLTV